MPDPVVTALASGDGKALAAALARKKKPALVKSIAAKVDIKRWDVKSGRALLGASAWLLAQPDDIVRDFLPALAIAAARALHAPRGDREQASATLEALRPYVSRNAWVADLVARSGCHFVRVHAAPAHALTMRELARAFAGIASNPYFVELAQL